MTKYNFKKFFDKYKMVNDEFASDGHFIIKRSYLKKSQNEFVSTFTPNTHDDLIKQCYNKTDSDTSKYDSKLFEPVYVTKHTEKNEEYNIFINSDNFGVKEDYYNFIKDIKCRIFYFPELSKTTPMAIYEEDNGKYNYNYPDLVGIIFPCNIVRVEDENRINYNTYINTIKEQEEQKQQSKENNKKCLYISNNKAVVRNKEVTCVADLVNDESYKNIYVESDYKKDGGMIFCDFGFVLVYVEFMSHYNIKIDDIKYRCKNIKNYSFENFKQYITNCLNNNQFINVADIKLMELAGESLEYIQTLTDHRQKILDMREQEHNEIEIKKKAKDKAYIDERNKIAEEIITQAEQAIINKQDVKNVKIVLYKSHYESNATSLILHLMKKYNINVPLKTQGWINQALANIIYDKTYKDYSYQYYKSSVNSTKFASYLYQLVYKIKENYGIIAEVS
jgi:hypothetical protein